MNSPNNSKQDTNCSQIDPKLETRSSAVAVREVKIVSIPETTNVIQFPTACDAPVAQVADVRFESNWKYQDWRDQGLAARIAYRKGYAESAQHIVRVALTQVGTWAPGEVKTLAILVTKARLATFRSQFVKAVNLYEEALALSENIKDFDAVLTCEILDELAEVYFMVGDIEQSVFLYQTSMKIDEMVLHQNRLPLSRLLKLAETYRRMDRMDDATNCLNRAEQLIASPIEEVWIKLNQHDVRKFG